MLTGTLRTSVGPNPATKTRHPASRYEARTVEKMVEYAVRGEEAEERGRREGGGTD
jgi:hypothetical protein